METNDVFSMLEGGKRFFIPQFSMEGHALHFGSGTHPSAEGFCRRCQRGWQELLVQDGECGAVIEPCRHEYEAIVHNLF